MPEHSNCKRLIGAGDQHERDGQATMGPDAERTIVSRPPYSTECCRSVVWEEALSRAAPSGHVFMEGSWQRPPNSIWRSHTLAHQILTSAIFASTAESGMIIAALFTDMTLPLTKHHSIYGLPTISNA